MTEQLTEAEKDVIVRLLLGHARERERKRDSLASRGITYTPPPGKRDATLAKIARYRALADKVKRL